MLERIGKFLCKIKLHAWKLHSRFVIADKGWSRREQRNYVCDRPDCVYTKTVDR